MAVLDILYGGSRKQVRRRLARAGRRDNLHALDRMTKVMDGRLRIVDDPPLVTHVGDSFIDRRAPTLLRRYRRSLPEYRRALLDRYTVVDVARKVVGVGSVGTRCYIILLVGAGHDDPLFLQIKEAVPSVLQRYLGRSAYTNQGKRVVRGQQVIQAASDIFLGWGRVSSTFYYLRQLRDMKGSIRIDAMGGAELRAYAGFCGTALARTHARSGDPARISGYLGTDDAFDRALTAFASAYADQTERDHAALVAAVRSGRVAAVTGI